MIRINLARYFGALLALRYSYILWGGKGCLFTLGLLLSSGAYAFNLTLRRKDHA